jgi:hypothetical protein
MAEKCCSAIGEGIDVEYHRDSYGDTLSRIRKERRKGRDLNARMRELFKYTNSYQDLICNTSALGDHNPHDF